LEEEEKSIYESFSRNVSDLLFVMLVVVFPDCQLELLLSVTCILYLLFNPVPVK